MDRILVVNAGSSSVKFQVFALDSRGEPVRQIKGQFDGIGVHPQLRVKDANGQVLIERNYAADQIADVGAALVTAGAWLRETQNITPIAVGHRVVHGGPKYSAPVLINSGVIDDLDDYAPLAPLHQPNNLAPIRAIKAQMPDLPQVACFDTAFHRNHGALADHYAIPEKYYDEGVRRYGFHGLSYEYIATQLPVVAPAFASKRVIIAHLGSGASMCAMKNGRSVESTMGFTALDGLPMGTRPGQLDPGIVLYLIGQKGMTVAQVQKLLYGECGLKGLSGVSNDVRELQSSGDPRAQFALDYFVYRIGLNAGLLAAALGGLDAFVFTAGIGENSPTMRARIVATLQWLGGAIDAKANEGDANDIASGQSRIGIYVMPTDEEFMIARHTATILKPLQKSRRIAAG
jgi:acetate kinase